MTTKSSADVERSQLGPSRCAVCAVVGRVREVELSKPFETQIMSESQMSNLELPCWIVGLLDFGLA